MPIRAFVAGVAGTGLTAAEAAFLREAEPWGLILFRRNCDNPGQVAALVEAVRAALGRRAPVLIDQEGGRVQRLVPPHWARYPAAREFARLYSVDVAAGRRAAWLGARLIAHDLAVLGVDVNCLPVLDLAFPETHDVIGTRAYSRDPRVVADLGRAVADGLLNGGVLPVVKHLPGHGRATADSHRELPVVGADRASLEAADFAPFRALADLPIGMTAHIVYTALDPAAPATVSPRVIDEVVRGWIGFDGLLLSDDLSMQALSGTMSERAGAALAAGCDIALHCNGDLAEMQAVAAVAPVLEGRARARADAALALRAAPAPIDPAATFEEMRALLARAA